MRRRRNANRIDLEEGAGRRPEGPGIARAATRFKPAEAVEAQYAAQAAGWSDEQYADAAGYLRHRAELVVSLGPRLEPGERVLDLACGDGGLAGHLQGFTYLGADASSAMVAAARARGVDAVEADLNEYVPPEPVAATTLFRALYYVRDRPAFFRHVASFTESKLVFDFSPRRYDADTLRSELAAAGFGAVVLRAFLVPQTRALPSLLQRAVAALEPTALARMALRYRFTYVCAAARTRREVQAATSAGSANPS